MPNLQSAHRLEIIATGIDAEEICSLLTECGASGYTLFHHLSGWGDRGHQRDDDIDGFSGNVCILSVCAPTVADRVLTRLEPILQVRGGLCTVTEVQLLDAPGPRNSRLGSRH